MRYYNIYLICRQRDSKDVQFASFDFPKLLGIKKMYNPDQNLKQELVTMLRSDLVVTIGDWHEDENCKKAVNVARIANLEIIHESQYASYVEQNYNRSSQ